MYPAWELAPKGYLRECQLMAQQLPEKLHRERLGDESISLSGQFLKSSPAPAAQPRLVIGPWAPGIADAEEEEEADGSKDTKQSYLL